MLDFEEISVLDKNSLYLGVPTHTLMENAGSAVAEVAMQLCQNWKKYIVIFCGLGNNGGDGMVAARYLAYNPEFYVKLYLLGKKTEIRSKLAFEQFHRIPNRVDVSEIDKDDKKSIKNINLTNFSVIIDAMLGVGISGTLKEPYKSIVNLINSSKTPKPIDKGKRRKAQKSKKAEGESSQNMTPPVIISVDIPTGLGTKSIIIPDYTITFHDIKTGMSTDNSGQIIIRDIGIPKDADLYVGPGELIYIPKLKQDSHKGDRGRLLIVGGGPYTGAPALVGMGALRTGVDLVHIATPDWVSQTIASFSTNFIIHPLGSGYNFLSTLDVDDIIELVDEVSADAVVIGPGLGRSEQTFKAVHNIIKKLPKELPLLLDADAFSALVNTANGQLDKLLKGHTGVLTPHKGELKLLMKAMQVTLESVKTRSKKDKTEFIKLLNDDTNPFEKQELLMKFVSKIGPDWTVLLKGPVDIIADGNSSKLNRTGNVGMTVGGTGDVLAGITGALLAMGLKPINAAKCSAFINGYAGDLAFKEFNFGLTATDIIDQIPKCWNEYLD